MCLLEFVFNMPIRNTYYYYSVYVIYLCTVGFITVFLCSFTSLSIFRHAGIMTVFENCTVVLDVKNLPFKEKNKLRLALLENGGSISYVINKEVPDLFFTLTHCLSFFLTKHTLRVC